MNVFDKAGLVIGAAFFAIILAWRVVAVEDAGKWVERAVGRRARQ